METAAAARECDQLLLPFLKARDRHAAESNLAALLSEHATPIIKGVLRSKLGVSLRAADGSFENQEALEIENDVVAILLVELTDLRASQNSKPIGNFKSYVAVVTFHACAKYLRRKNPERVQLKSSLRHLLTTRRDLALWQSDDKEWFCGLTQWQGSEQAYQVAEPAGLKLVPGQALENVAPDGESIGNQSLEELLKAVLLKAGRPVGFEDLVNHIAGLKGGNAPTKRPEMDEEAETQELAQLADPRADVATEFDQRLYLQKLWMEIRELPSKQRAALLLNLTDAQGRGMIAMFPITSVATVAQLAATLEIPLAQFAEIWNELPWDDARIAVQLGITRQQVVNLRKCARQRLARRMRGF